MVPLKRSALRSSWLFSWGAFVFGSLLTEHVSAPGYEPNLSCRYHALAPTNDAGSPLEFRLISKRSSNSGNSTLGSGGRFTSNPSATPKQLPPWPMPQSLPPRSRLLGRVPPTTPLLQ